MDHSCVSVLGTTFFSILPLFGLADPLVVRSDRIPEMAEPTGPNPFPGCFHYSSKYLAYLHGWGNGFEQCIPATLAKSSASESNYTEP
mmetsp:Transcript_2711/g.5282  ORF Transcript_2711/g.5282 Transcript_2711/m.5282 type:complete len:88 (+) Transcript_2711:1637-1900(+)